ncbi:hypothetical protein ACOI1C_14025 [Bacillus sp. DJP31]|uniref:hypothetical protein n=1 Tax=Bacillus sp. DJP31 TaxID=3409789 RepID=UPI003BB73EE5
MDEICSIVKPSVFRRGSNTVYRFRRKEIEKKIKTFNKNKNNLISKKDVANVLGVNVNSITQLSKGQLLK